MKKCLEKGLVKMQFDSSVFLYFRRSFFHALSHFLSLSLSLVLRIYPGTPVALGTGLACSFADHLSLVLACSRLVREQFASLITRAPDESIKKTRDGIETVCLSSGNRNRPP